ncbi:MAG: restriction endonuclease subunit S [Nanoarchaeales archaeon]|nr:restriction endonuclease subunit S [Nanoarchaeales archaeon]
MADWEVKTLGEVCLIERGGSPRPIQKYLTDDENGINWIKIGDTKNVTKYIYETRQKIIHDGIKRSRMVNIGDFILSNSMSFGKPYIMKTSGCIHDGWLVLRENKKLIDKDYLYYLLSSHIIYKQFDNLATGSTVRNLNIQLVKKVKISFPTSIEEQKRIVKILDSTFEKIDKSIENTRKNLKNSKEVFESYLNDVFSSNKNCKTEILENLTEIITKGSSPRWQGINYVQEPELLFITSKNVGEGKLIMKKKQYLEIKFNDTQKRSILKYGDVLTNIVGASIGRTAIYNLNELANINQAVCILRCINSKLSNSYLMNLLNSPYLKKILHDNEVDGARANLSLTFFKNLEIPLPTLLEQEKIVKQLDTLSEKTKMLEGIYSSKLIDLEDLKKSVLEQAFSGKL